MAYYFLAKALYLTLPPTGCFLKPKWIRQTAVTCPNLDEQFLSFQIAQYHSPKRILFFNMRSRVSIFICKYAIGLSPLMRLQFPQSS